MDKISLESIFQLEEFQGLHPQAMENIISSLQYLLSLNSPSISLIVTCFVRTQYTSPSHSQALRKWVSSQQNLTPLALLENMLRYCISEAWNNADGVPYTSFALRKDIPNQQTAHSISVHRALEMARRCDTDYSSLQVTAENLKDDIRNGEWDRCKAEARNAGVREADIGLINELIEKTTAEEEWKELPVLYIRLTYILASNGTGSTYKASLYQNLDRYFDSVIARKLENINGAKAKSRPPADNKFQEQHEKDKKMISILAKRQTDWDSVYKTLQTSTMRGMAGM